MIFVLIAFYFMFCGVLSWHDWRTTLLPDRYTCPLLWGGLLFNLFYLPDKLPDAVLGATAGYCIFSLFYWAYRLFRGYEGLGYGDVKLLAALGAWHGWQALSSLIVIASLCGLAVASFLLYEDYNSHKKTPLPFGPFLVAAGFCVCWPTFRQPFLALVNLLP